MKRLFLAVILMSSPFAAFAACTGGHEQAMSCAQGSVWDPESQACVPVVTG